MTPHPRRRPAGSAARRGAAPRRPGHRLHQQRRRTPTPGRERRRPTRPATTTPGQGDHDRLLRAPRPTTAGSAPSRPTPRARPRSTPTSPSRPVEGTNDVNQQISQVETLISKGVDVIVMLPFDGKALTETGLKAMEAGIPVVNLDRVFDSPQAYRALDRRRQLRHGRRAGTYIAEQLKAKGISDPVIAEIQGIDNLPLTQDRSQGFADALKACRAQKVSNQVGGRVHRRVRPAGHGQPAAGRARSSTRSGTTTTTRASACWRRSTRPAATSSSWSAAPAPRT